MIKRVKIQVISARAGVIKYKDYLSLGLKPKVWVCCVSLFMVTNSAVAQKAQELLQGAEDQFQSKKDSIKHGLKEEMDKAAQRFKGKLFTNPELGISQQYLYQNGRPDSSAWLGQAGLNLKFNTLGIPLQFNVSSATIPGFSFNPGRQQLFNFKYQQALQQYKHPALLKEMATQKAKAGLSQMKSKLLQEVETMQKQFVEAGTEKIALSADDVKGLILNPVEVGKKQLNDIIERKEKEALSKMDAKASDYEEKKAKLSKEVDGLKERTLSKVQQIKAYFKSLGLGEHRIREVWDYSKGLKDESELMNHLALDYLNEHPTLKEGKGLLQRLNGFKTGQYSEQLGFNSLDKPQFLNGFQLALNTRKGAVSVGYAKDENLAGINETEFNQSIFAPSRYLGYFKANIKQGAHSSGSFTFSGTSNAQASGNNRQNSTAQQTYALGISQQFKTSKLGELKIDLSKSFSSYNDAVITDFRQRYISEYNFNQFVINDFNQSLSAGLHHSFEQEDWGFQSQVYFNYAGIQYQNPGNSAFGQPRTRWGAKLKKTFFDRKLSLAVRADQRSNNFGLSNQGWTNQLIDLESRLKLGKRSAITLKYQDNFSENQSSSLLQIRQQSYTRKYQFGGQTGMKLGAAFLSSQVQLALNQLSLPTAQGLTVSDNLMITAFQTLVLGKQAFTATLFCNRDQSAKPLIGNMLNADLAWQYSLLDGLSLSSGITYLEQGLNAKQAGAKQGLQFTGLKNMDLNVFLDLRKNLIDPQMPALFATTRGEFSLTYYLRKL